MAQAFFSKNLSAPGYTPIFGCCCLIGSLFFEWPQYCGSNGSCVVSCWESGFTCCQPVNKQDPRKDCIILDNYCHFGTTNTYELIKVKNQCFCFDFRAALPTDDGNPCLINICGLNLCKNWKKNIKCCRKLSELHWNIRCQFVEIANFVLCSVDKSRWALTLILYFIKGQHHFCSIEITWHISIELQQYSTRFTNNFFFGITLFTSSSCNLQSRARDTSTACIQPSAATDVNLMYYFTYLIHWKSVLQVSANDFLE